MLFCSTHVNTFHFTSIQPYLSRFSESHIPLPEFRHMHVFSQKFIFPILFPLQISLTSILSWLTPHQPWPWFAINNFNISFIVSLVLTPLSNPPPLTLSRWSGKIKPMNGRRTDTNLRENLKSVSTNRGTILEGNAARMKNGNLYREMESVFFYLINVNLLSHFSERNVELVKLHTGHIFIRYKIKFDSLAFLHKSWKHILLVV